MEVRSDSLTPKELLELFAVPDQWIPDVYLLGCFARRVTLYSQQVRALNLIYALRECKKLEQGCEVVVVGAGAAGLMAAAGAAHFGARVTLIERLQGPMELQRNSRQRWVHPFSYDWPDLESVSDHANLPFFDWQAGYAEQVAIQIEELWRALLSRPQYSSVTSYWNADTTTLTFRPYKNTSYVRCLGTFRGKEWQINKVFDVLILAVGFGVEPEHGAKSSYWSDDGIDGGFQTIRDGQKWLISGCGDGGLTDLMRLCIHRFRHQRVTDMFSGITAIKEVEELLLHAHMVELLKWATPEEQEIFLSKLFESVKERYDLLPDFENTLRRLHKPRVYLAGAGPSPYGPNSSILNRLIICQLARHGAFEYIQGPAKIVRTRKDGRELRQVVVFGESGAEAKEFHRVLERHGTERAVDDRCFEKFRDGFVALKRQWDLLPAVRDPTRKKQWPSAYFPVDEHARPLVLRQSAFATWVRELGIRADALTIINEVSADGSSTFSYQFENLSTISGVLSKIHFTFSSTVGSAGGVQLDAESERLGLIWQRDIAPPAETTFAERIDRMRKISGNIVLLDRMRGSAPVFPLTFGLTLHILNGVALSKWEFQQLYPPCEQTHFNGERLGSEIEYLARVIWFPIERLRIKLILPNRVSTPPFLSMFQCKDAEKISKHEILSEDGVLEMFPAKKSQWHPKQTSWERVEDPFLNEDGITVLKNTAPRTWELNVVKPMIGSCYSLDWVLHSSSTELEVLAPKAASFRKLLLDHRNQRIGGSEGLPAVRECFRELYENVCNIFNRSSSEQFEVSLMTYDESRRELVHIEGLLCGNELPEEMWKSSLPFGLGLGGACFKEGELLLYQRDSGKERQIYIPLPSLQPHEILVSLPLDHPEYSKSVPAPWHDRSRQCLGVLNIASFVRNRELEKVPYLVGQLSDMCQKFCSDLYANLMSLRQAGGV